jgi:Zn-dependent peptidase ImmA (M78 family)
MTMATKTWTEPLVRRLMKRYRTDDPRPAIETYARELLAEAKQDSLPVNVELVASVQGVRQRHSEYDFAGRIYVEDGGQLVMDLNSSDNENRQRFTCAHELMHTAFPGFGREKRYRLDTVVESNPVNREEEYLCDLGAAALLMPADLISSNYKLSDGLGAIESLSRDADVSLEAAGNRLAELSQEPGAFLTFEYGYKPADRPALRRGESLQKRVRLRYGRTAHLDIYLPRFKSAPDMSPITLARKTGNLERGTEELPGAEGAGPFLIEAKCYGADERERVLAVAQPVSRTA